MAEWFKAVDLNSQSEIPFFMATLSISTGFSRRGSNPLADDFFIYDI